MKRGLASATQILTALDKQSARRPPISQVALSSGLMSPAAVLKALDEQRRTNEEFCACAIRLGGLSPEDRDKLKTAWQSIGPKIGEVLVEMGVIGHQQLDRELQMFADSGAILLSNPPVRSGQPGAPTAVPVSSKRVRSG